MERRGSVTVLRRARFRRRIDWHCDGCDERGKVYAFSNYTPDRIRRMIRKDHRAVSPHCEGPVVADALG
jgi:hypothetical protein